MNDDVPFLDPFFSKARSIEELAEYLDCSPRYIQSEIAKRHLKAMRPSTNFTRLLPDDIRQWLNREAKRRIGRRSKKEASTEVAP